MTDKFGKLVFAKGFKDVIKLKFSYINFSCGQNTHCIASILITYPLLIFKHFKFVN